MSYQIDEVLFNPVFITATNMVIPITTIPIKNFETKIVSILNLINLNIYYSILAIILLVYSLYKLKKFI